MASKLGEAARHLRIDGPGEGFDSESIERGIDVALQFTLNERHSLREQIERIFYESSVNLCERLNPNRFDLTASLGKTE